MEDPHSPAQGITFDIARIAARGECDDDTKTSSTTAVATNAPLGEDT